MNPILVDFPEKIETERLYFRPCLPGDGKIVHESIAVSRDSLKKWLPFAVKEETVEEVEAGIRASFAEFINRSDFRLHIYLKENHLFVGSIGLHRINWEIKKFEIGYWCDSRQIKNGYITEAAEALTAFCFEHFKANRVEIRCDEKNIDSRRIPERLGFPLEGILRNDNLATDNISLRSTCVYAKVKVDD
ncbi:GNAT family N-acetyltransferase [Cytobacillus kochii]|uniref:GNAT family N-acetyltransferase n=1 Tax=Cytobacillus kochii TaxID=859143 RepID=UPI0024800734|nr:GNAT family N-acetyltransferase [Cytobacillus kochii]